MRARFRRVHNYARAKSYPVENTFDKSNQHTKGISFLLPANGIDCCKVVFVGSMLRGDCVQVYQRHHWLFCGVYFCSVVIT